MLRTFTVSSNLPLPADEFWNSQSLATVNQELKPWYRMTAPREYLHAPIAEWSRHPHLFKSWVLFAGLLPVDRHLFGTVEFTAPTTFVENSSSWLNRLWKHQRAVVETPGGCSVCDTVSFAPRISFAAPLLAMVYMRVFRHRHAVLMRQHKLSA